MKRIFCICMLVLLAAPQQPGFADDQRVLLLEQKLTQLERQVATQARRMDQLERASTRTPEPLVADSSPPAAPEAASPTWLIAANWQRIKSGMSELEVISILGPPTTVRNSDDAALRTLFFALEIGQSGFLAGNVELKAGKVAQVHLPVLR